MDQHRHERVILETGRHRIEGTITLSRDGYRSRVSDVLNASEREFLSLTNATISSLDSADAAAQTQSFVIVSRRQVVLAIPLGEEEERKDPPSSPPPLAAV